MKYPQSVNKSIFIREVYEDTYENPYEYIVDTMIWENRVDELHTIWHKGKDPRKDEK
jgi:hypothetical protein